jgi:hypothetical protein
LHDLPHIHYSLGLNIIVLIGAERHPEPGQKVPLIKEVLLVLQNDDV